MDNEQKQVSSFRLSKLTIRQLDWLMREWGTSKTETLAIAVDRAYQAARAADYLAASVDGRTVVE